MQISIAKQENIFGSWCDKTFFGGILENLAFPHPELATLQKQFFEYSFTWK